MPAYGDLVIIVTPKGKRSLRRVDENQDMHTQDGILRMADVVEAPFGSEVCTTLGVPYRIQKPTLNDIVKGVKRQTQILYPKDIGYICMRLGVGPNRTVIEAGTGSGSLTVALSWFSGTTGKVHTFEAREEFHKLARRNLEWAGVGQNVTMHCQDIAEGFGDVTGADALFLDVRTPWDYLKHIPAAVTPGAALAFLLPTVDQVGKLLLGLEQGPFDDVEVCEILVRRWKPIATAWWPIPVFSFSPAIRNARRSGTNAAPRRSAPVNASRKPRAVSVWGWTTWRRPPNRSTNSIPIVL